MGFLQLSILSLPKNLKMLKVHICLKLTLFKGPPLKVCAIKLLIDIKRE